MKAVVVLLSLASALTFCTAEPWAAEEETAEYWYNLAAEELGAALFEEDDNLNKNVARNVIMFLGDGMGIPSHTAGRILKGQMQGYSGEDYVSAMDSLDHTGFSRTYAVDKAGTDSAASATAYLCGVKANYGNTGVNAKVKYGDCEAAVSGENDVESIMVDAYRQGKSTGVLTTTRINHASPSGCYAHTANRNWYADSDLSTSAREGGCKDIAQQFYDSSDMITVALGGGRKYFHRRGDIDEEYDDEDGDRDDGQDLIEMWLDKHKDVNSKYVWNASAFHDIDPIKTDKLIGFFEPGDMNFEVEREDPKYEKAGEPSLAEMTEKTIQILQKNPKGYFMFVEGGRIDHGHHGSDAYSAIHDWVAFDNAIQRAKEMTSDSDTLIVVTADHSHTFHMGGLSYRGNPIYGLAGGNESPLLALDGKPYTTVRYGNGDGWQKGGTPYRSLVEIMADQNRGNLTGIDIDAPQKVQSAAPLGSETHGAEDVMIFARGPMSHLFHKVHDNSYIPYAMRYASCLGNDLRHCDEEEPATDGPDEPVDPTQPPATEQPEAIPIAANFLGRNLDASETTWALYIQFVLCIALCLTSLNTMVVCLARNKKSKVHYAPTIPMNGTNTYTKFENGKV